MQVRCPHCRSPIELTDESSLDEVDCPSCGSSFSLVGTEDTQDYSPDKKRRIAHFELVEQLGAGAFGAVWRARDTELDRDVAIKIPRKGQLTPEESEKFLREARAAAQLNHPGIVSVHEVGREDDTIYIVSDLVEGVTLTDWLSGHKPTPREAAELCARIADALQHAHNKGVTHRDLKPGNLMIDREGNVHLMDFGLAKRDAGEVTMTVDGQVLGTPAYLSPEAARGDAHKADARSDIYSLGVILFEMLTGERPFRGNARMLIHQLLTEDAPSPRKLNAAIPKDLETICLKCLEKDPRNRFGTARLVSEELLRFLDGEPIHARPISAVERVIRWSYRNPRMAALATVSALLLVTLALGGLSVAIQQRNARAITESLLRKSEQRRYISDMYSAQQAWRESNVDLAIQLLLNHIPMNQDEASTKPQQEDLRGFEWYHLWWLCRPAVNAPQLDLHRPGISGAFSPDGNRFAVGHADPMVTVFDLSQEQPIPQRFGFRELNQENEDTWLMSLAFLSNDELVYPNKDRSITLRNLQTGVAQSTDFKHAGRINALAVSSDGTYFLTGSSDGAVVRWNRGDMETPNELLKAGASVYSIACSPNGELVAAACNDGNVHIWRTADWESSIVDGAGCMVAKFGGQICFSPDSKFLAWPIEDSGLYRVKIMAVSDFERDKPNSSVIGWHTGEIRALAYLRHDQRMLLASGTRNNELTIWDPASGERVEGLRGHRSFIQDLAYSEARGTLASVGRDYRVRLWDLNSNDWPTTIPVNEGILDAVPFGPDQRRLLVLSDEHRLSFRDLVTGEQHAAELFGAAEVQRIGASEHGSTICALADNVFLVWQSDTQNVTSFPIKSDLAVKALDYSGYSPVYVSLDGELIALGTADGQVMVLDRDQDAIWSISAHEGAVTEVCFSPDHSLLISGGRDGNVKIWDTRTRECVATSPNTDQVSSIQAVAFSPEGQFAAFGGDDGVVRLWYFGHSTQPESPRIVRLLGHTGPVKCLRFSQNGETLFSGGGDGNLIIWDIANQQQRATFLQSGAVSALLWSGGQAPDADWNTLVCVSNGVDLLPTATASQVARDFKKLTREQAIPNQPTD